MFPTVEQRWSLRYTKGILFYGFGDALSILMVNRFNILIFVGLNKVQSQLLYIINRSRVLTYEMFRYLFTTGSSICQDCLFSSFLSNFAVEVITRITLFSCGNSSNNISTKANCLAQNMHLGEDADRLKAVLCRLDDSISVCNVSCTFDVRNAAALPDRPDIEPCSWRKD